jgi:hypothetical protein
LFDEHIDKTANIKTDKWTAYTKISKEFNITQEKSNPTVNFKQMHTIFQQINQA